MMRAAGGNEKGRRSGICLSRNVIVLPPAGLPFDPARNIEMLGGASAGNQIPGAPVRHSPSPDLRHKLAPAARIQRYFL